MTNDLISREAVLEILMRYCPDDDGSCSKADVDPRETLDEIENLPAVDAAPVVHARWIEHQEVYDDDFYAYSYECSECGCMSPCEEPYCNCGAKMDKETLYA